MRKRRAVLAMGVARTGRRIAGARRKARSVSTAPLRYSDDEWTDLGALTIQQYPDPAGRLRGWAQAFVGGK